MYQIDEVILMKNNIKPDLKILSIRLGKDSRLIPILSALSR